MNYLDGSAFSSTGTTTKTFKIADKHEKSNICICSQSRGPLSEERTLLRYSVECKNKELIALCLEYGADINEVDESSGSLLHTVIQYNPEKEQEEAFDILHFLIERGRHFCSFILI